MKKVLLFLLLLLGCVILLGVLLVVFLIHVSRNQVMDGPGMENRPQSQNSTGTQSSNGTQDNTGMQGSIGTQNGIGTQGSIGTQGEEGEKSPTGAKQDGFADYDGIWYNRDKSVKLVIQKGFVKGYRLAEGSYQVMFTQRAELGEDGCLYSASRKNEVFGPYRSLYKKGDLLYAPSAKFISDMAQPPDEEFAREGHEADFAPLPVYVKAVEEVSDRRLESCSVNVEWNRFEWQTSEETFVLATLEGFADARRFSFFVSTGRNGVKTVEVEVSDGNLQTVRNESYELSPETEAMLAGILLSPEVLENNPHSEQNQMSAPTVSFLLEARFLSGEQISIHSSCGILIGDKKILEIARLFLDGE